MRKIAEGDYREMIERYRGRAMRVISELEAGDNYRQLIERELKDRLAALEARGTEGVGTETGTGTTTGAGAAADAASCAACGTHNDQDAQFCKKCGAKLGRS
jgi:hypothetical protein